MNTMEIAQPVKVETARFGTLKADPASFITFGEGVYGFPGSRNYLLIDTGKDSDFRWLQSVEDPALAFLVTDPELFYPGYRASIEGERPLLAAMAADYQFLCIVAVDRPTRKVTVNLAAPLAVHVSRREGCQLILRSQELRTDHDLVADYRASLEKELKGRA